MPVDTDLESPVVKSLHKRPGAGGVERHRWAKIALEAGSMATSMEISAAGTATGQGMLAAATGATITTGGTALITGGAALTVGSAVMSGRAAKKTYNHLNNLQALKNGLGSGNGHRGCAALPGSKEHRVDHEFIATQGTAVGHSPETTQARQEGGGCGIALAGDFRLGSRPQGLQVRERHARQEAKPDGANPRQAHGHLQLRPHRRHRQRVAETQGERTGMDQGAGQQHRGRAAGAEDQVQAEVAVRRRGKRRQPILLAEQEHP